MMLYRLHNKSALPSEQEIRSDAAESTIIRMFDKN